MTKETLGKTEQTIDNGLKDTEQIIDKTLNPSVNEDEKTEELTEEQGLDSETVIENSEISLIEENLTDPSLEDESESEKDSSLEEETDPSSEETEENDAESDFIEAFTEIAVRQSWWNYYNISRYIKQEPLTTDNIKKFYEGFKGFGPKNPDDYAMLELCSEYFQEINKK
jgi:hypothetical protein